MTNLIFDLNLPIQDLDIEFFDLHLDPCYHFQMIAAIVIAFHELPNVAFASLSCVFVYGGGCLCRWEVLLVLKPTLPVVMCVWLVVKVEVKSKAVLLVLSE